MIYTLEARGLGGFVGHSTKQQQLVLLVLVRIGSYQTPVLVHTCLSEVRKHIDSFISGSGFIPIHQEVEQTETFFSGSGSHRFAPNASSNASSSIANLKKQKHICSGSNSYRLIGHSKYYTSCFSFAWWLFSFSCPIFPVIYSSILAEIISYVSEP